LPAGDGGIRRIFVDNLENASKNHPTAPNLYFNIDKTQNGHLETGGHFYFALAMSREAFNFLASNFACIHCDKVFM